MVATIDIHTHILKDLSWRTRASDKIKKISLHRSKDKRNKNMNEI